MLRATERLSVSSIDRDLFVGIGRSRVMDLFATTRPDSRSKDLLRVAARTSPDSRLKLGSDIGTSIS